MKNDSPNKFLGGLTAGIVSGGGSGGGLLARLAQAQSAQQNSMVGNAGSLIGGGAGTASAAPVAPMAPTGGDMQDPFAGKTFSIVESPANMKGNAKPVFNESTSDAAAMMYGTPLERQMSMPQAPMFMSAKQEKAFGPGSEVYESGNTAIYEGLKQK